MGRQHPDQLPFAWRTFAMPLVVAWWQPDGTKGWWLVMDARKRVVAYYHSFEQARECAQVLTR